MSLKTLCCAFSFDRNGSILCHLCEILIYPFYLLFLNYYLFLDVLGLRCSTRAFSSCRAQGLLFLQCVGFSLMWLLLWSTDSWREGSIVVAHELSCPAACGIFLDQGLNLCPLHWQVNSYPLHHQGSPYIFF